MATVKFLTNLACAGGTVIGAAPAFSGTMGRALDNSERLTLQVPWDAAYLSSLTSNTVVSVTDDLARTYEWYISQIDDSAASPSNPTVTITAEPAIMFLQDCGPIYDTYATSDYPVFNNGLVNATPYQYLSTYIMPWLSAMGYSWISIGTVDYSSRVSVAWNKWSPLQIIQEVAAKTQNEIEFRRNGTTGYYIDIIALRNSSAATRLLRTDRNVLWLQRTRRKDPIRNAISPTGMVAAGEIESATLGMAAWKVSAISGTNITLADPNGGDGPIAYDDQLNGLYLLKSDATLVQITDSVQATQVVTVSSAAGITVNDHVEIRKNSSGNYLTELTNPAAVTAYGRIAGAIEDTSLRGERNHVPNPLFSTWSLTGPGDVLLGTLDTSSTTTPQISGLANGTVIAVGDIITSNSRIRYVTSGGTVAGGVVTVTVNASIDAGVGQPVYVWRLQTLPTNWTRPSALAQFSRYNGTLTGTLTAAADGTQAARQIALKSLTAASVIQAGDHLVKADGTRYLILTNVTVDGAGKATVLLASSVSVTNNDALTVVRCALPVKQTNAVFFPTFSSNFLGGAAYSPALRTPSYKIRANGTTPTVWCSFAFTIFGISASDLSSTSTTYTRAKVEIYNVDTSTVIATVTDGDWTVAAGDVINVTLRKAITLSASTTIALIFYPPAGMAGITDYGGVACLARGGMVHIGNDTQAPLVDGSHANDLWQLANNTLSATSAEQRTLRVRYADLARLNPDLATETLDVGQNVRLMSDGMAGNNSLDITVRVTRINWDLLNPSNSELTLDTLDARVTRMIGKSTTRKLYVNLDILLDSSGKVVDPTAPTAAGALTGTATVSTVVPQPKQTGEGTPPEQQGAYRGVVPGGDTSDNGMTAITPTRYYKKLQ